MLEGIFRNDGGLELKVDYYCFALALVHKYRKVIDV